MTLSNSSKNITINYLSTSITSTLSQNPIIKTDLSWSELATYLPVDVLDNIVFPYFGDVVSVSESTEEGTVDFLTTEEFLKSYSRHCYFVNFHIDRKMRMPYSLISCYGIPKITSKTLSKLFVDCYKFNGDVSGWDTSRVTNMSFMFGKCYNFNCNISRWDTSRVTNMSHMFSDCSEFKCNISRWDTSRVTNMSHMFINCYKFNCNISRWDTSRVTNMSYMFTGCYEFNGDISKWNTSNVITMNSMFFCCSAFNIDISVWNVSKVQDMTCMFYQCFGLKNKFINW